VETPNEYYFYLLELVTANSVQPRSFPSHFKIRPSATPVYGPSPLLSKTRLSGPAAPVTWSNRAAWRLCIDPATRTSEKSVKMQKSVRKVAAWRLSLEFMFKMHRGKMEHLKLTYIACVHHAWCSTRALSRNKIIIKTGKLVNTRVNEFRHEHVDCVGFICLAGVQKFIKINLQWNLCI